MDSTSPLYNWGKALGSRIVNSVGLSTDGYLYNNTPSSHFYHYCHSKLDEGDCVRMIVDLDSTSRTVKFFVNGEGGKCYMSGIPSSVRIGFSVSQAGTSFRIDNLSRLSRPAPISEEEMDQIEWGSLSFLPFLDLL
ncbi:hypothetical protein BLNAU_15012 [Blattamonas nauphoetae]|uniref:B30.2/SPRY domain-containing protein n=1 Tax=Blattamonas nauphoetae TaxID=2049346 RepID=A0ABQ9XFA6_9EUKA|nr:hypothetical protein BLNAU_15012 [Blattamonas nauphoetae]